MKRTFLEKERPMTVGMIQKATAEECVSLALDSIGGGADAVGLQLESLPDTEKTDEKLRRILDSLGGKPCYFTNYRYGRNDGKTDETLARELVHFTQLGGTLADIPGDFFDKSAVVGGKRENCRYPECTTDENAIAEQKKRIAEIHEAGGEVLMSSHVMRFLPAEEVLSIALDFESRGADVVKIVTAANSTEEEIENLRTTALLKKELKAPFLFLSGGTHYRRHRLLGPMFGCGYYLCVARHYPGSTASQPLLSEVLGVLSHTKYIDFCGM